MKEELKNLCRHILVYWKEWQEQTELEKASFAALAEKFDWGGDDYSKV